jgi:hypothetical protein
MVYGKSGIQIKSLQKKLSFRIKNVLNKWKIKSN